MISKSAPRPEALGAAAEVFLVFLRLGLTSFGGPVAHLGYFRTEIVARRRWLSEAEYADLVALCQFLPGPASSQVGLAIGLRRAGLAGAAAAWTGFTLPSAAALIAFGYGLTGISGTHADWLHGLLVAAVAVVAQAVWGMARVLTPDRIRLTLAVAAALLVLAWPGAQGQILAILAGGIIGRMFFTATPVAEAGPETSPPIGRKPALAVLGLFFLLLAGLPFLVRFVPDSHALALFESFYRSGALVFGGGHVVLPLLQAAVVPTGWTDSATFLAGYGAAQAVPGPLFTFAAYLGTVMQPAPSGWFGGLLCLFAIYLPSFLLVIGVLPFWHGLRGRAGIRSALQGINAAVVGILLAALYHPVWTSAIKGPGDFGLALAAFLTLVYWKAPPWLVVLGSALGARLIGLS
jgi:chromate transporter